MIKNEYVEQFLRKWLKKLVQKYKWLTIKFEYNEKEQRYLVSYSPKEEIENDDNFMRDSMMLEDMFNDFFGDYAPLFCDEEEYFKLSPNAEIIKCENKNS